MARLARWALCACALLALLSPVCYALPTGGMEAQLDDALRGIDTEPMQKVVDEQLGRGTLDLRGMIDALAHGGAALTPERLVDLAVSALANQFQRALPLFAKLLLPALFASILSRLRDGLESDTVGEICRTVCYLIAVAVVLTDYAGHVQVAGAAIERMSGFTGALMPVLLTLLAALGGASASGILAPAVTASTGFTMMLLHGAVFALISASAALAVLNNLSERVNLSRFMKLTSWASKTLLGISVAGFLGIMTVQGALGAALDGISIRTAKYAIDNMVPIVGGEIADTVDTLIACSLLVKNAVGVTGLIALALVCLSPLAQLLVGVFAYRLCAALLEPLGDSRIAECMQDFGGVLSTLFVAVLLMCILFFFTVGMVLVAGNMTVMMR